METWFIAKGTKGNRLQRGSRCEETVYTWYFGGYDDKGSLGKQVYALPRFDWCVQYSVDPVLGFRARQRDIHVDEENSSQG